MNSNRLGIDFFQKKTVLLSLLVFCLSVFLFFGCADEESSNGNTAATPHPTGVIDYGDADGYSISGTVKDTNGVAIAGILLACATDLITSEKLMLYSDSEGAFSCQGLPSWVNAGEYDVIVQTDSQRDVYERRLYWVLTNGTYAQNVLQSSLQQNMTLRPVVNGTKIMGTIKDSSGNPISRANITLLDLQLDSNSQGPAYNVASDGDSSYFTYDGNTGTYTIQNGLAGGTYSLNININGYSDVGPTSVSVTPGETLVKNITTAAE